LVGTTISNYRVVRRLDSGRFEDAFVAEDLEQGGEVVLKFLPPALAMEPAALQRVEQAAVAMSELTLPGRQTVQKLVHTDGHVFLVLGRSEAEELLTELRELWRQLGDTQQPNVATAGHDAATLVGAGGLKEAVTLAGFEAPGATDVPGLAPGRMLGTRYRIIATLGRGGMGEVWHAFDLKLQVEVALKALRRERFPDAESFELLRHEVRAGREVISPNVCRIYDLVEEEEQELLSMEYVDGRTLIDFLHERGTLDPREAGRIASQFLAGLEAIHDAGLVHRDIKPENVMITRTGRVVVMDFGIARALTAREEEEIAGTMPYMAPELLRGEAPDVRTDLYAVGVVLAEMIAPEGVANQAAREQVWQGVREDPPRLVEGAWKPVLERTLTMDPSQRFATSRELALALEAVTPRVVGADDKNPYPGLESFSDMDAEYFFGREAEVEALWKRLQRSQLLAVIGASGAGKSSFLQAGVIPTRPEGWSHVLCHPGTNPFLSLARALAPEFADEPETVDALLQFEDPDVAVALVERWRRRHREALVIIDQFEELFTQCSEELQSRFAALLRRLALDADVRVLLSMRDDFLIQCQEHATLAPIFADLTALGPLSGNALRRALVQPALACGYRFEDEELVEEILDDVRGERGALPLLAFAMSRLWELRDRETGRLTRAAYDELGRVGGALAQHAEATLDRVGQGREEILREIFRNLVTAQGTRAAMTTEELLSVFDGDGQTRSQDAQEALRALVDARLLTSYDETLKEGDAEKTRHRVEVVHESLFRSWPRLVRWRTLDAAGAQLRDQLRQAARLWDERGRSEDLLWTGTAFREFAVWRERYTGGLTSTEEEFARAMVGKAERQRRRRRRLTAVGFVLLLGVVGTIGTLWQQQIAARRRSETAELEALNEARRAEAQKLLALGKTELKDRNNSSAVAYAIKSLELSDDLETRRLVLEALWQGPMAIVVKRGGSYQKADFSPDGRRLAVSTGTGKLSFWNADGTGPIAWVELAGQSDRNARALTQPRHVSEHQQTFLDNTRRSENGRQVVTRLGPQRRPGVRAGAQIHHRCPEQVRVGKRKPGRRRYDWDVACVHARTGFGSCGGA
jgi:hypothetical protein